MLHNAAHSLCTCIVGGLHQAPSASPASKQVMACSCTAANVGRYWQILAHVYKRVAPLLDLEEPAVLSSAWSMQQHHH
jgi:hypothetical protein